MEINGSNPLIGLTKDVQRLDSSRQSTRTSNSSGEYADSDRLELSVRSLEISHLEDLARSTPDVRESRVEQVRSDVESGTYNIKAEKIAEKIIGGNLLDEVF
jgi:negative regulator of flagellin synthesis FlgM